MTQANKHKPGKRGGTGNQKLWLSPQHKAVLGERDDSSEHWLAQASQRRPTL